MLDFSLMVIEAVGLWGAVFLIALEVIVLPIPSELVLLLTGVGAGQGNFSIIGAIAATTLGSLIGAGVLYLLGRWVSEARIRHLVERFGKYIGFRTKDFDKAVTWFERYGVPIVLFGRLIPVVRSLVSIPAGLTKMNPAKFFAYTALGSLVWNSIWISAGFLLGENWEEAERFSSVIDYVVYAVLAYVLIQLVLRFFKARRAKP